MKALDLLLVVGIVVAIYYIFKGKEDELATEESGYRGDDISNWKLFGKRMKRIKRAKF